MNAVTQAQNALLTAQEAAAREALVAANARRIVAAAQPLPACITVSFATIPEMHVILLFYGIHVLELNGKMDVDAARFFATRNSVIDMHTMTDVLRTNYITTKVSLQRWIF